MSEGQPAAGQFGDAIRRSEQRVRLQGVGTQASVTGTSSRLFDLVSRFLAQSPLLENGRAVVTIRQQSWGVLVSIDENMQTARLTFVDGSQFSAEDPSPALDQHRAAVDTGPALLQPVTARELGGVEVLLGQLWHSIGSNVLTEAEQAQIVAMADFIKSQQMTAAAGETPRWQIVGTVRAALIYLVRNAPKDALAWWKFVEILAKIDWHNVAHVLSQQ